MSKVRVSALAKELQISSEVLVQVLRSTGVAVKSHSSTVDESVREQIEQKLAHERAAIKEKYVSQDNRTVRRRPINPTAVTPSGDATTAPATDQTPAEGDTTRRAFGPRRGDRRGGTAEGSPLMPEERPVRDEAPRAPRPDGDRPQGGGYQGGFNRAPGDRPHGDRPQGGGYQGGGQGGYNRGPRPDGDRPQGGGYQGGGQGGYNRGPRPDGDRPQGDRPQGGGYQGGGQGGYNRGPRPDGDRPQGGGGQGGYNRGPRPDGDRPQGGGYQGGGQGGYRPQGDRPQGGGYQGGGQGGYRPQGDRPQGGGYQGGGQGGQGGGYQGGGYQGGGYNRGGDRPQGGYQGGGYQGGGQGGGYNRGGSAPLDPKISADMVNKQAELKKVEEGASKKKGKKKPDTKDKYKKEKVSEVEMKANIKKTLAQIGAGTTRKKYKKTRDADDFSEDSKILEVSEFISVGEFTSLIHSDVSQVIAKCLELGLFVTINQRLDFDTIELLADEFGFEAKLLEEFDDEAEEDQNEEDLPLLPRAPVVTVMGHVDHGKTSLLDYIRKANVAGGESGGITQHIASYEVETKNGKVAFLDTPGHEAFAAMRARGSQVTDVVVLVVAADSTVQPQTKEAIGHARAAGVPIVVAINKMDLPTANPDKIKGELAQFDVLVEEYGGQVSCVELSAKTGVGVDTLLELLALETELLELKAPREGKARGVVIESELDKGKGAVATVLIQRGTLLKGDPFVTGSHSGRVREMYNDRGVKIDSAGPSQPVMIIGLTGTPQAGDSFRVMDSDQSAREMSAKRRLADKEREVRNMSGVTLDNFFETIKAGQQQSINIIVKGDVDGSVEAVAASLEKLSTEEIKVNIILKGVGGVKESDIMLAQASKAIIIGFHISPNPKIREHAREAGVDIRTYRIIYEAVDEVKAAMIGMLIPDVKEEILGQVEIREVYKVTKLGQIAGCMVRSGKIERNARVRLLRDDVEVADTTVASLQRLKDQAKEVLEGFECGIMLANVNEYQVGDRIEVYREVQVIRKTLAVKKPKEEPKPVDGDEA